jgi:hypothetical protein
MTSEREQHDASAFERQAHEAFDDSVTHLDAATLSRLNQSRQRALAAARGRSNETRRGWMWVPAGALAAVALIEVLLVRGPSAPPDTVATNAANTASATPDAALDPLTILAAGDDLELAAEADLDFYAWVELQTEDDGVT